MITAYTSYDSTVCCMQCSMLSEIVRCSYDMFRLIYPLQNMIVPIDSSVIHSPFRPNESGIESSSVLLFSPVKIVS